MSSNLLIGKEDNGRARCIYLRPAGAHM